MSKKWTKDDRGESAIQMRKELGLSNVQIASRLSGPRGKITPGAVAGFLWREGVPSPQTIKPNRKPSGWQNAQSAARKASPKHRPANGPTVRPSVFTKDSDGFRDINISDDLANPSPVKKTIHTLTESCCRWPIGDPQKPDFHFCGRKRVALFSYCELHAQRAFQAVSPSVRRNPVLSEPVPSETAKLKLVTA